MGEAVVGGAEANPNGFSNFNPQNSTDMSTLSMSVVNSGNAGGVSNGSFCGKQEMRKS